MPATPVLSIQGLTKRYGRILAVDQLQLNIPKGSVYGILGPNGSGKTTTLGMVLGTVRPSAGDFSWFGEGHSPKLRRRIGSILEKPNLFPHLNAWQHLKLAATIKDQVVSDNDISEILETIQLYDRQNDAVRTFSLGMKQRLALGHALIGQPEVLVLDEPTNGLDPQGIHDIRSTILRVAETGMTILLASHILDEVEKTCSHVAILKKGKLLTNGPVSQILGDVKQLILQSDNLDQLQAALMDAPFCEGVNRDGQQLIARVHDQISSADVNKYLFERGIVLSSLRIQHNTLESQFLELTK